MRLVHWDWAVFGGTLSVILVVAGALVADQRLLARADTAPCTDAPVLGLTTADLPGFDSMTQETTIPSPVNKDVGQENPQMPGAGRYRDLVTGWARNFIIHSAIEGPYRADLDARARAIHYPIQYLPYVPLVGEIVQEAAGPLEVYEDVDVYTTSSAAAMWVNGIKTSIQQAGGGPIAVPGLPAGASADSFILGPDDGLHESDVQVFFTTGTTSIRLSIQGAPHNPNLAEVARIASTAIDRITEACPATAVAS